MTGMTNQDTFNIKPMPFWQALLYFGLPTLLFRISIYNGIPMLIRLGLTPFAASIVAFTVPAAILFAFALGFYKRDGHPLTWSNVKARFRLLPTTGRDWLWGIGEFLGTFLSIGMLTFTAQSLIAAIPAIAPLRGNWGVSVLFFVMLFFNIVGEELCWRGYVLPRQEKVHGPWAWAINGLLW